MKHYIIIVNNPSTWDHPEEHTPYLFTNYEDARNAFTEARGEYLANCAINLNIDLTKNEAIDDFYEYICNDTDTYFRIDTIYGEFSMQIFEINDINPETISIEI